MKRINQHIISFLFLFFFPFISFAQEQTFNINQLAGQSITLKHHQNDLVLEYVGIHFDSPGRIQYEYKLEGFHNDWVNVGTERLARFNNLSPGKYTFSVKAANADGVWSDHISLDIQILQPWWWTWEARISYVLLLIGGIYSAYNYQLRRKLEQEERFRLKELDEVKSKLYTNITHELRTPLAIIQGMAGQIEGNEKVKAAIQRNSINLLTIINQMLDLSKLEAGQLSVNMIQDDVIRYMNYLMESFHSFAESKDIRLHYLPQMKHFMMDYDPDKLMKIAANLVSNAIKFTEKKGDVYVLLSTNELLKNEPAWIKKLGLYKGSTEMLILQVRDTGIGIPKKELDHIFDRFYQVDDSSTRKGEGTGIGLAYARELVKLMDGFMEVESEESKGSSFTIYLPVTRQYSKKHKDAKIELLEQFTRQEKRKETLRDNLKRQEKDLPLALIVEDNWDVKEYLSMCLQDRYHMVFASNGQQGIDMAIDLTPDIVLSDVMMPVKDGFELCKTLKLDKRTSHIPIILLTAKADASSRLEGLRKGADAYMPKPFNQEELYVRLEQLIQSRKRIQERYQQGLSSISLQSTIDKKYKREDNFILDVQKAILDQLDNEQFDTECLCKEVGMSASQLYRKLKALTGKSTAIYIRSIRLTQAMELLKQTSLSVSEIAYEVGFKDPAYFSRCFSVEFGKSPKSVRG